MLLNNIMGSNRDDDGKCFVHKVGVVSGNVKKMCPASERFGVVDTVLIICIEKEPLQTRVILDFAPKSNKLFPGEYLNYRLTMLTLQYEYHVIIRFSLLCESCWYVRRLRTLLQSLHIADLCLYDVELMSYRAFQCVRRCRTPPQLMFLSMLAT